MQALNLVHRSPVGIQGEFFLYVTYITKHDIGGTVMYKRDRRKTDKEEKLRISHIIFYLGPEIGPENIL